MKYLVRHSACRQHHPAFGLLAILFLALSVGCKPASTHAVTKAEAQSKVAIANREGWKEAVSEEGRFRILFPSAPQSHAENNNSLLGFRLSEPNSKWFVLYNDFTLPRRGDDATLRDAYKGSVEGLVKKGAQLVSQHDVRLNGKLGTEVVLMNGTLTVSYIRAFLNSKRMYTLEVDRKVDLNGSDVIPKDVQQFFDSFTYWDVN